MNSPLLQRLENRKNRKLADIRECERKFREIELQSARLRGEVSSLEDAIDEVKREMPAIPTGGGGAEQSGDHKVTTSSGAKPLNDPS